MKTFGAKRVARAKTVGELGGQFGPDKKRRLIVTLSDGDVITMRPEKTRRTVVVHAKDVYRFALLCEARVKWLEKARAAKDRRAERLAANRLASAERRYKAKLKKENQQ